MLLNVQLLRLDLHFFPPKLSTIASENDSLKPILGRLAVNCTHLTELHLLSDVALEFDDVFQLVSSCPGLRKLTLTPCLHWTTDQIRALVEAAPNLEYLALFQARLLDDTILDILSTLLPSLHTFIVHSCPLVTDAGLCRLANNCSPALTWIKVIRCPQLSLGILKDTKFSQESGCPMEYSSYPSGMGMGYCRTSL